MTEKQASAIEHLRTAILRHDSPSDGYEYKRFEVSEMDWGDNVSLITEVGLVGDEGTMASFFARTRRHIIVGPRGGCRLLNTGRYSKSQKKIIPAKTNARGLRSVVIALTV